MELTPRTVEVERARLTYHHKPAETSPGGLPVVMLHAWFGCWQFWQHTLAALSGYDCYAVDLYSLGEGGGGGLASPPGLARAVVAMMDAEGIQRCTLIGNSMGGIAAQALASAAPERVARLVLVGTGASTSGIKPDFNESLWKWVRSAPDPERTAEMVAGLLARKPPSSEFDVYVAEVMRANKEFMAAILTEAFRLDLRPRLGRITASTLVVRGELDVARTREHVRDLLEGIPDSQAVEMPGAGHSPMVDSPSQFNTILRQFLEGRQVEGASRKVPGTTAPLA
jgi:3-oxoadipate enol-lactonase